MTEDKKYEKDADDIIDPKSGKIEKDSQFAGDKQEEQKAISEIDTDGDDTIDHKLTADQEYLKTETDEADQVSGVYVESRRTRTNLSENPSEDEPSDVE